MLALALCTMTIDHFSANETFYCATGFIFYYTKLLSVTRKDFCPKEIILNQMKSFPATKKIICATNKYFMLQGIISFYKK